MRWALLCAFLLGMSAAHDFPAYWKQQKVEFSSCPAGTKSRYPDFNDLTKYVDPAGHLRALHYMATNVTDFIESLTFEYSPSGQLQRVEHFRVGMLYGRSISDEWSINAGKVVAATRSSSMLPTSLQKEMRGRPDFSKFKWYSHPIPPHSIPALYLGKPTPEWMNRVACSGDD